MVEALRRYVRLVVEARMREVDLTGARRSTHGSDEHVNDLTMRINDLIAWRDRCKRGSEQRATYARLVQRLRGELASAKRANERAKANAP